MPHSKHRQADENSVHEAQLVLRRIAIRTSFHASAAPVGVEDFINSVTYEHKDLLQRTMSGLFDHMIPQERPEWWIVQFQGGDIKGVALVSYSRLNMEGSREFIGVEHLIVADTYRNRGVGSLILKMLQKLVRKSDGLGGVNLECEPDHLPYYSKFGFVRRPFQIGQFVKLVWKP